MRFTSLAVTVLTTALIAISALAFGREEVKQTLAAAYKSMDRAYAKADFKTIGKYFSPNCTFKRMGEPGMIRTPIFLKGLQAMTQVRTVVSSSTKLSSVKKVGTDYEAQILWMQTSRTKTPDPKGAKTTSAPKSASQRVTDTWQQVKGGWVIVKRLIGDD